MYAPEIVRVSVSRLSAAQVFLVSRGSQFPPRRDFFFGLSLSLFFECALRFLELELELELDELLGDDEELALSRTL